MQKWEGFLHLSPENDVQGLNVDGNIETYFKTAIDDFVHEHPFSLQNVWTGHHILEAKSLEDDKEDENEDGSHTSAGSLQVRVK